MYIGRLELIPFLVLFQKALELRFVAAEFFLAVRAVQATVGGRGKALGVQPIGDLPSQKKRQSASEQAVCIPACHKRKRCEHHGKIPVVDTAAATAFILHKPCLERTEEQDADHIAHTVGQCNHQQNVLVDDMSEVEGIDSTVEGDPSKENVPDGFLRGLV